MKAKRAGIYVRVSTIDQNTDVQETELKRWAETRGFEFKVYRDHGQSGAKEKRPALVALLSDVRRGRIDIVGVWSLDRLARSLKQLLVLAEEFQALGVDLFSHQQSIDTSTPAGRLTYQVLGAVAEFERELLRERVKAGLAQARRAGRKLGRPPLRKFDRDEVEEIRAERLKGVSIRGLAKKFGTSQWMIAQIAGQGNGAVPLGN